MDLVIAGNRLEQWVRAGLVFVGLWLAFVLSSRFLLRRLRSRPGAAGWVRELALSQVGKLAVPVLLPCSLIIAARFLELRPEVHRWLRYLLTVGITFCVVRFGQSLVSRALDRAVSEAQGDRRSELATLRNLTGIFGALLWMVAGLFLLANAGIDVSSALAGFGIGGIAIALAAQRILGDLWASVGILLDKPFRVGDVIGAHDPMSSLEHAGSDHPLGTVERIGLRTTSLRSVNGEELILPNSTLSSSRISNFSRASRRRVTLNIALSTSTGGEKRRALPQWIAGALATVPRVELERAQLGGFAGARLSYEVSYFVPIDEPRDTVDAQHQANLAIVERLDREGVVLA